MQKFIQTAMFYLLVSVLIMMAGIIVGYLWSSDIGPWFYSWNILDGIGVSDWIALVGVAFSALTLVLAVMVYGHWRHQFSLDNQDKLIDLSSGLMKLFELNVDYLKSLSTLQYSNENDFNELQFLCTASLLKYEHQTAVLSAYDVLLGRITSNHSVEILASTLSFNIHNTLITNHCYGSKFNWDQIFEDVKAMSIITGLATSLVNKEIHKNFIKRPS